MKVPATYYKSNFRWPATVEHIVQQMNEVMAQAKACNDKVTYNMANRIKSLCIKHYKEGSKYNIQFCREWAKNPKLFLDFVLKQCPNGRCRITRIDEKEDFEPSNIKFEPLK